MLPIYTLVTQLFLKMEKISREFYNRINIIKRDKHKNKVNIRIKVTNYNRCDSTKNK